MTDTEIVSILQQRLQSVQEQIDQALKRAGRTGDKITLIAVTKTVGLQVIRQLVQLGIQDLGENRPQVFWKKVEALNDLPIRWHFIGSLQRNKVAQTIPHAQWIHSVDSVRLLQEINKECQKQKIQGRVLLEINASREANKHGFAPEAVSDLLTLIQSCPHVHVEGLMTMAAYSDDPEQCRATFQEVKMLQKQLQEQWGEHGLALKQLSMGMSNDFTIAIEEGATMIRLGTILFEGLPNQDEEE